MIKPISAADEFRREPVGVNPPEPPLEGSYLRNPTGAPRLGDGASATNYFVRPRTAGDNVLQKGAPVRVFPSHPTHWTGS